MKDNGARLSARIRGLALKAGIHVTGFTHADPFEDYLLPGSLRQDPGRVLSHARTLMVFGVYIGEFVLPAWEDPFCGRTSRLFLSGFYSDVVVPLDSIRSYLKDRGFSAIVCDSLQSDTSVLPLKLAALRAGLGWQGKNTLLLSREYGSFLALGGIITDAPLDTDAVQERDRCGTCRACQDACPTNALAEPYRLNRRRCLASLYREASLPREICRAMGNRIVECEICQDVCPWNRKHMQEPLADEQKGRFDKGIGELTRFFTLSNLFGLSEREYESMFRPFRTDIPYRIFRRNVVIALGNTRQDYALSLVQTAAEDEYPEVQAAARMYLEEA
jgi:epoxyqueuosine reductase